MAELLSAHTAMPVAPATDGVAVEPNHVYLIPPGKCLKILHGKLVVSDTLSGHGSNLVVDQFFCSLAEDQGERAIAIALSGTGTDGTRGIRVVKENGGIGDGTMRGVREIPEHAGERDRDWAGGLHPARATAAAGAAKLPPASALLRTQISRG